MRSPDILHNIDLNWGVTAEERLVVLLFFVWDKLKRMSGPKFRYNFGNPILNSDKYQIVLHATKQFQSTRYILKTTVPNLKLVCYQNNKKSQSF